MDRSEETTSARTRGTGDEKIIRNKVGVLEVAQDGLILTEAQLAALEKAKSDKE